MRKNFHTVCINSVHVYLSKKQQIWKQFPIEITIKIILLITGTLILWTSSATTASHSTELSSSYKQSVTLHFEIKLSYQKQRKTILPMEYHTSKGSDSTDVVIQWWIDEETYQVFSECLKSGDNNL